ncbi:hypothetical protein CA54_61280 [Symmachiella macrocystis]|uniref:Sulfatase n=1 Tax=Symmachiella macrocystis TaxID=2527985 RepID=A0A5C6AY43_9PLAN|nr:DUF1501 domain-containing protein [Symmachiella macrocystis]TWU03044.1 hypothetical protein CA54_61280 [Symmachiella macrocystis]
MLKIFLENRPVKSNFCDGISRRQALRLGSTSLLGGLTLPKLLEMQANAADELPAKAKSVIFLFLAGGPSTIDMWDLKPQAPAEIRGPFQQISTAVPGTFIGEHLPECAKISDKISILRSHSHKINGHTTGFHYVMTGYEAAFAEGQTTRIPTNVLYPSLGSIISKELGSRGAVPPYITMPNPFTAGGPGFLGARHASFVIENDPAQPDFEVKDLVPPLSIGGDRMSLRQKLLAGVEGLQIRQSNKTRVGTMSTYYDKAYDLITSPQAKAAFDLRSESESLRAAYGHTSLGQSALLARRIAEAGGRFIGVDHGSWDTHTFNFRTHKEDLIPDLDKALSALVTDLDERGMLDETLVVVMGEMGRTPRIGPNAGRGHWPMAQSIILAGGGTKPGAVVGGTDKHAAYPVTEPYGVQDVLTTVLHALGVQTGKVYETPLGRPIPMANGGRVITDLFA